MRCKTAYDFVTLINEANYLS